MKLSATSRVKGFLATKLAVKLLLVSLGLTAGAFAQYPGNPDNPDSTLSADLWREWMSVLQRAPSQISGPRLYLMTDREVLQTSPTTASFQNGSYRMVLADGSVPDVDGDNDGHTDVVELKHPSKPNWNDPLSFPVEGNPPTRIDRDAFSIVIADGSVIGVADSSVKNTPAVIVKAGSGSGVQVVAAPASKFVRPVPFRDFSSQFPYYFSAPGQPLGSYIENPLSLYYLSKDYPNPGDCNALETTMVYGLYKVEFPTIQNAPNGRSSIQAGHRLVPNGSLTVGLKKPTWLVRSLKSEEKANTLFVEQKWVNGKLKFDPYLPLSMTWDNIVTGTFATTADYIEVSLEEEELDAGGVPQRTPIRFMFRGNAAIAALSTNVSSAMYSNYGTIPQRIAGVGGFPPLHQSVNGNLVMKYFRYANGQTSADLSTVTVRVPVDLSISYPSWRKELFSGTDATNDSISGPNADPDGDGLTNQQEFDQASNPRVPTIGVSNPTSANIAFNAATLGGTVNSDPVSKNVITERGVVYSPTSTNSNPLIAGSGVITVVAPGTDGVFTVNAAGLSPDTSYSFRAYAISGVGTSYSTIATFTTLGTPLTNPTFGNVTLNSATLGATVSGTGFTLFERGVVYSASFTNPFPTVDGPGVNRAVSLPAAIGTFTVPVTGLLSDTQYAFRGYVITDLGTFYTSPVSIFTTLPQPPVTVPTVTTPTSSGITSTSAVLGGNVTSDGNSPIIERGVVYSPTIENDNPLIGDPGVVQVPGTAGTGVFTVNVPGLVADTTYSFRAYAVNAVGTSYTSDVGSFTALPVPTAPVIASPTSANITSSSATLGGDVTSTGGSPVLQRGVVFSLTATNANPVMGGTGVSAFAAPTTGTGVFTANATNLSPGKSYSFKAYAINAVGTSYTTVGTFTTAAAEATITALTLTNLTASSATLGANVTDDGGSAILERGFIYSQASVNGDPLVGGPGVTRVIVSGTTGAMTATISGLVFNTGYIFKAYAINAVRTAYSAPYAFTTRQVTVSNATATAITFNSAVLGGAISGAATTDLLERGVVYSMFDSNPSPAIDGPGVIRVKNATLALGAFTVSVSGLGSNTKYAYSPYVITPFGTFYSSPASTFTTLSQAPLTLPAVTAPTSGTITGTSAALGGNVTADGGSAITERGVVYSVTGTDGDPFIGDGAVTKVVGTGTTGVFTVNATGLLGNTTYSFRAYAINSVGTSHTSEIGTFTTDTSPTITSPTVATITVNSAVLGGNLTSDGNSPITERGLVYSLTSANNNPQIGGTGVIKLVVPGTVIGVFSATVPGLQAGSAYTFRAYSINAVGTGYTGVGTFTTATAPTVVSPTSANIAASSATLGGNVTSDGGAAVVQRGVVFSLTATNANPAIGGTGVSSVVASTAGIGVFTVNVAGLLPGKIYSFKAYAINGGTSYTPLGSFTTAAALATITSPTISGITATTATLGGSVASDTTVSERGVVYTLDPNIAPVLGGPGVTKKTATGTTGAFTVGVTGLSSATSYYFRAYATNTVGTSYSVTSTFATNPVQLLGLALMEWVPAPQQPQVQALQLQAFSLEEPQPAQLQTFAVEEPQPTAVVESPQVVPGFVYYKADVEAIDPMSYQIKTSSDNREWLPINENDWTVTETSAEIRVTWVSTGSPPTRIFFRIESTIVAQ